MTVKKKKKGIQRTYRVILISYHGFSFLNLNIGFVSVASKIEYRVATKKKNAQQTISDRRPTTNYYCTRIEFHFVPFAKTFKVSIT